MSKYNASTEYVVYAPPMEFEVLTEALEQNIIGEIDEYFGLGFEVTVDWKKDKNNHDYILFDAWNSDWVDTYDKMKAFVHEYAPNAEILFATQYKSGKPFLILDTPYSKVSRTSVWNVQSNDVNRRSFSDYYVYIRVFYDKDKDFGSIESVIDEFFEKTILDRENHPEFISEEALKRVLLDEIAPLNVTNLSNALCWLEGEAAKEKNYVEIKKVQFVSPEDREQKNE